MVIHEEILTVAVFSTVRKDYKAQCAPTLVLTWVPPLIFISGVNGFGGNFELRQMDKNCRLSCSGNTFQNLFHKYAVTKLLLGCMHVCYDNATYQPKCVSANAELATQGLPFHN